ncbi:MULTISPECIES: hypothetical protein [Sphingobacterium]|uniref:hypothetical protein n=1 Tax=Sphingobacterium TaxID=28453 RepID=UPI001969EA9D|nr:MULTISPECIES: hypothetical protein [unclassified Sphingobacterium]
MRNGPAIDISGLKEGAVVDGQVPIMINAYGKGDQIDFLIEGSETPQGIPWWVWILIIFLPPPNTLLYLSRCVLLGQHLLAS